MLTNRFLQFLLLNNLIIFDYRLLGDYPNTYVFTKAVAEEICKIKGADLPLTIFRPAIGNIYSFIIKPDINFVNYSQL